MKTIVLFIISIALAVSGSAQTAAEWQQRATAEFPDLAAKDSPLNKLYVAEYNRLKASTPDFFLDVQWPLVLARRCNAQLQPSAIPGIPSTDATAAAQTAEPAQQIADKLEKIIIPQIQLHEASLRESLDFVATKTKELDPAGRGIAIHLDPSIGQAADARISLSLARIPTMELLRYIASLVNLKFRIAEDGVTFLPADARVAALVTKRYDNISPAFFNNRPPQNNNQCQHFLTQQGIEFPKGANSQYDARAQQLYIRNTEDNLKLADTLISVWYDAVAQSRK